jgi:hypothetical protein
MGLINLGHNYKAKIEEDRKRDEALEKANDRFKYPTQSDISDMIGKLLPVRWNDIYFPCANFHTNIQQAIHEHKYPNRDSARLEAMGREPLVMHASGIFVNTIVPGPADFWKQGDLFPTVYNKLLLASFSGETKILNHPSIGEISCKLISMSIPINAKFRGGVVAELSWKETIADDNIDSTLVSLQNQIASAKATASTIDNQMPTLNPSPADLGIPEYHDSLLDMINKIETMINAPSKFAGQIVGTIDSLEGRCHMIINKIHESYETTYGQINQLSYKLKADAQTFRDTAKWMRGQKTGKAIAFYTTEKKTVFTNLTGKLNTSFQDLLNLNPLLAASPTIPIGTAVRYYK